MNPHHRALFEQASIHVPLKEFIKRITIEAGFGLNEAETPYKRANIRAMRKALYALGLNVSRHNGHYQLTEYLYDANGYAHHSVPPYFARTERGTIVFALARFLNGEKSETRNDSSPGAGD
jgi:hypothetical protein